MGHPRRVAGVVSLRNVEPGNVMDCKMPVLDVAAFLDDLADGAPKSPGERAVAAHLLTHHAEEVAAFLAMKEKTGQTASAARYRNAVARHSQGPGGCWYSPGAGALRYASFRLSPRLRDSLTFPTDHKFARACGYILSVLITATVLFGGCVIGHMALSTFAECLQAMDAMTAKSGALQTVHQNSSKNKAGPNPHGRADR